MAENETNHFDIPPGNCELEELQFPNHFLKREVEGSKSENCKLKQEVEVLQFENCMLKQELFVSTKLDEVKLKVKELETIVQMGNIRRRTT